MKVPNWSPPLLLDQRPLTKVYAYPPPSPLTTAMQNDDDAHETPVRLPATPTHTPLDQIPPEYMYASPLLATATQKDGDAHETALTLAAVTERPMDQVVGPVVTVVLAWSAPDVELGGAVDVEAVTPLEHAASSKPAASDETI